MLLLLFFFMNSSLIEFLIFPLDFVICSEIFNNGLIIILQKDKFKSVPASFGNVFNFNISEKIFFLIFIHVFSNFSEYAISGIKCWNFDFIYVIYILILALTVNCVVLLFIICFIFIISSFLLISYTPSYLLIVLNIK